MPNKDPDQYIRRLQAKDPDAFDEFIREHHGSAYGLAKRLLRNDDDAKEITQESFLAAYEGIEKYKGRAKLKSWLLSITYNKAVDRLKSNKKFDQIAEMDFEKDESWQKAVLVTHITDYMPNPEQNLINDQLTDHLNQALLRVPPDSKAVFELRELQGLSSKEVAAVLNINEAAVRVRLHRVRQFLIGELQHLFAREV